MATNTINQWGTNQMQSCSSIASRTNPMEYTSSNDSNVVCACMCGLELVLLKMQANKGSEPQPSDHNPKQKYSNNEVVAPSPATMDVHGQQWVAMQYPAATMVKQHGMMAAPHYVPYHPHNAHQYRYHPPPPQQSKKSNGGGSNGENRTIWVGDLRNWMDEDYLHSYFASTREGSALPSPFFIPGSDWAYDNLSLWIQGWFSEGYGFVEFFTHAAAEKVLQSYSCIAMPNTVQLFRLNWATFSTGDKRSNNSSDLSIFVGDLAADVTDILLHQIFASKYPSVKAAKVVIDASTGRSKGYGVVRFDDDYEISQAMAEMNGVYCSSRPMRIGAATPRKSSSYQQQYSSPGVNQFSVESLNLHYELPIHHIKFYAIVSPGGRYLNGVSNHGSWLDGDSFNTTIFVGGLDPNVTDEDLRQPFSQYGEILSVKIPVGKGCGFVQFANRNNAEAALQRLSGTTIGKQTLRVDYGHQWTGAYYGGSFFDGYGYALAPPHSPNMYAATYGAYSIYRTHQQQVN
ncbi:Polyadenylate-binding protein RBP47C' [Sesamum alatum]|uniref:Polyadenylate-binding protein RBP47C n=1 Tax=Sesamum alatum TaxID=300844 RepID=A0AAE1YFI0_9LAMI|nr:Polyadenylate-binding protein RBP47C' [Sesamum alatum]